MHFEQYVFVFSLIYEFNSSYNQYWFSLAILNSARARITSNDNIIRATDHMKVLSLLRREFKTIRATWSSQCDLVHSYDEVGMAKSRFDAVIGSTDKLNYENPLYQVNISR